MWHKINFRHLAILLLPTFLRRQGILTALLHAAIKPVAGIHEEYTLYREQVDYKLRHNGQVCYLRALLNRNFDPDKGIRITDAEPKEWEELLYRESENWPMLLGTSVINRESFIGAGSINFVVHVPARLQLSKEDCDKMVALINDNKLASKRYTYESY